MADGQYNERIMVAALPYGYSESNMPKNECSSIDLQKLVACHMTLGETITCTPRPQLSWQALAIRRRRQCSFHDKLPFSPGQTEKMLQKLPTDILALVIEKVESPQINGLLSNGPRLPTNQI